MNAKPTKSAAQAEANSARAGADPLLTKMKAIEAHAIERFQRQREQATQESLPLSLEVLPAPPPPAKVVKLPLWPDAVRAVPNGMLRSAMFGAIRRGERRYLHRERIAALDGIEIFYTGERLDQSDLDVWETVLHLVRLQSLGNECRMTAYQILKALGKTDSGKNRDILDLRLSRLNATAVRVKQGRYSYEGSLIDGVYRDEETKAYVLILNPKIRVLFEHDQFTQIDRAVRRKLDGKPLAQWLHSFYASHAKPYPVSIAKLRELSGSEAGEVWKFRQTARAALDDLADACKINGQPFSYKIQDGVVHVEKEPSQVQRLHLSKKIRNPHQRKP